jgi:hypothetical protein
LGLLSLIMSIIVLGTLLVAFVPWRKIQQHMEEMIWPRSMVFWTLSMVVDGKR